VRLVEVGARLDWVGDDGPSRCHVGVCRRASTSDVTHPPSGINDHQICVGGEAEMTPSHIHHHVDELRHTSIVGRQ
jgi:hypothetical protein